MIDCNSDDNGDGGDSDGVCDNGDSCVVHDLIFIFLLNGLLLYKICPFESKAFVVYCLNLSQILESNTRVTILNDVLS